MNSSILNKPVLSKDQISLLENQLQMKVSETIYQASKDGFMNTNFNEKCCGKENTVICIIDKEDNIFGCYHSVSLPTISESEMKDIESTLSEKIYWKIPNNYFSIMESINKGVPVSEINLNSNISNSFRELAQKLSDDIVEQTLLKYRGL